jgi:hypothetical protein
VPSSALTRYREIPGFEGDVSLCRFSRNGAPVVVEAETGRSMTLTSGDLFLAAPGYRESTRWVVGGIPEGGLVPGQDYWVLSDSGVIGDLIGDSPSEKRHLGQATYLGAACDGRGQVLNMRQFAAADINRPEANPNAPLYLVLGTSAEVGKTTAAIAVLRTLRHRGHKSFSALKATGTSSFCEIAMYRDFGATHVFDCVDFGLPTTYPSDRHGIGAIFDNALDLLLSTPAEARLVECGGDILGANVPTFLACLKRRHPDPKVILAAPDALAALGAKRVLHEVGISINLLTGPCTDTSVLRERTQALCGVPAVNMAESAAPGSIW